MNLHEVAQKFKTTVNPKTLFGDNPEVIYRELAAVIHPDLYDGEDKELAKETFKKLEELKAKLNAPIAEISTKENIYRFWELLGNNGVSDIYRATTENPSKELINLLCFVSDDRDLMKNDEEFTKTIRGNSFGITDFFPDLHSSFSIKQAGSPIRYCNAYYVINDLYSAAQIKAKYPNGLEDRHLVWMFKRLLSALAVAHNNGIVYGGSTPDNIYFHAKNHGIVLFNWTTAVKAGNNIPYYVEKWQNFYPAEVLNKQKVKPDFDIYMAAKLMLWLSSNLDRRIKVFFEACISGKSESRRQDAWELLEDFKKLSQRVFGPNKYVKLVM